MGKIFQIQAYFRVKLSEFSFLRGVLAQKCDTFPVLTLEVVLDQCFHEECAANILTFRLVYSGKIHHNNSGGDVSGTDIFGGPGVDVAGIGPVVGEGSSIAGT